MRASVNLGLLGAPGAHCSPYPGMAGLVKSERSFVFAMSSEDLEEFSPTEWDQHTEV